MRSGRYPASARHRGSDCGSLAARRPRFRDIDAGCRGAHAPQTMERREDERQIVVRSFPSTDVDFADATGDALQAALEADDAPATLAGVVEERLRQAYRNARIHVQDEFGHLGSSETIWYAYRDGRIRETDPVRERLYSVVAAARRTVRESEIAIDHARKISRAAGYDDVERVVGTRPDEISPPPRKRP